MSSAIIGALRAVLGMDTAAFEDGVGRAKKQGKGLEKSMKKIGKNLSRTGAKMSAALTAPLVGVAYKSIAAQKEQEQAIAAVEAKLASMGETAGFTSAELQSMASVLQEGSLYGDEAILQRVTQNLLSFGNIQGEVFERGQQLALDLSATLGQDLQSSTLLLGKALNDPVKGLSALTRVGISFTEEQKNQIKAMAETGRVAEAQRLILSELESQYGGSAAALAKTDSGKITQAWNAVGDAMESVGAVILPVLADLSVYLKDAAEWFQKLDPVTQEYSVLAGALAAALGPALVALGLMVTALAPMAGMIAAIISPLGLLVAGLTAVATAIYVNWDGLEQDFPTITSAITAGINLAITAFERIKDVVTVVFDAVTAQIRNAAILVEALLSGDFAGAFEAGKSIVQTSVDGWIAIIGTAFGVDLEAKFSEGIQVAKDFGRDLAAYISSLAGEIWEAAKSIGHDLVAGLKVGLQEKLKGLMDWVDQKVSEITDRFKFGWLVKSPSRVFKEIGQFLMDGLALGITGGQADVATAMDGVDDALTLGGGAFAG
ncbi:MAG: phage tail length tape measure family protein, partial [Pseudoruegeria sp.]